MNLTPSRLPALVRQTGLDLAASPGMLLCVLLALNALFQPYEGMSHDARLYAAQVGTRFQLCDRSHDLYLKFGSQDRLTIFSSLMAPLVTLLGIPAAFFVVYLLGKALLLFGAQRLIGRLADDPVAAVLGLVFLAITPIGYGGNDIFHVNESFLTPRLLACALVLLALDRMLADRLALSAGLLAVSFFIHPLMAASGVLVYAFYVLMTWLPSGMAVSVMAAGAAALLGLYSYEPLGTRVFGTIDDEWKDITLRYCYFVKPGEWTANDWVRIGGAFAMVALAAGTFARGWARFLGAVWATAAIGLLSEFLALDSHYLLLLQLSPYRCMWLLEFLALPLGLLGVVRWWGRPTLVHRFGCLVLLFAVAAADPFNDVQTPLLLLLVFVASALLLRWAARDQAQVNRLQVSTAIALGLGALVLVARALLTVRALMADRPDWGEFDPSLLLIVHRAAWILPKLVLFAVALLLLVLARGALGMGAALGSGLIGFALAWQVLIGLTAHTHSGVFDRDHASVPFVAEFLRHWHQPEDRPPTVYWFSDVAVIWFNLDADSYYGVAQMHGCVFSRDNAIEGERRSRVVQPFELEAVARMAPSRLLLFRRYYQLSDRGSESLDELRRRHGAAPTEAALRRLCADGLVDVAVIHHNINGFHSATNGRVYIYDCRRLREHFRQDGAAGGPRWPG